MTNKVLQLTPPQDQSHPLLSLLYQSVHFVALWTTKFSSLNVCSTNKLVKEFKISLVSSTICLISLRASPTKLICLYPKSIGFATAN